MLSITSPLAALLGLLTLAEAHVRLTHPAARKFQLDFLDNLRTPGDCGMEPGEEKTILKAGAFIDITWRMGFIHKGGYRIEFVNGNSRRTLVPYDPALEWDTNDPAAESHQVTVPDIECDNCYFRLVRQAEEWGPTFVLRSCADVIIKKEVTPEEFCGNNGQAVDSPPGSPVSCECSRNFTGPRCQFATGCKTDDDCNGVEGHGECVELDNRNFLHKQCFCSPGWFGEKCEKRSEFTTPNFYKFPYIRTFLSNLVQRDGPTLYWRVEGGQLEMVVEAPTTNWVGIGWRPADTTANCQKFPESLDQPKTLNFANIHHMDCTDMVIGMARGEKGHIADYYTRDRSTPMKDKFWGGQDDISSGLVYENNGKTIMKFKKPLKGGAGDQNFGRRMHIIWAYGQDSGFYKEDQLKYHGSCTNCQGQATLFFRV